MTLESIHICVCAIYFYTKEKNLEHDQKRKRSGTRNGGIPRSAAEGSIQLSVANGHRAYIDRQQGFSGVCVRLVVLCPSCDLSVPVVRILNSQTAQHESKSGRLGDGSQNIAIVVSGLPCSEQRFQCDQRRCCRCCPTVCVCVDPLVAGQLANNQFAINQSAPRQQRSVCRKVKEPGTAFFFLSPLLVHWRRGRSVCVCADRSGSGLLQNCPSNLSLFPFPSFLSNLAPLPPPNCAQEGLHIVHAVMC